MTSWVDKNGKEYHAAHSFEAVFALIETQIRDFVTSLEPKPIRVYFPAFSGVPMPIGISPVLLAIAYNNESQTTSGASPRTFSHTTTGTDMFMCVGAVSSGVFTDNTTAVSYNSVAATKRASQNDTGSAIGNALAMWTLSDPATGANTVSMTTSSGSVFGFAATYSGADAYDNSTQKRQAASTSSTTSLTTVADNCWTAIVVTDGGSNPVAGSGTTQRGSTTGAALYGDSNGPKTPAGSTSMTFTWTGTSDGLSCMVSFSPAGGGGGSVQPYKSVLTLLGVG
jgi:hypothetical protein